MAKLFQEADMDGENGKESSKDKLRKRVKVSGGTVLFSLQLSNSALDTGLEANMGRDESKANRLNPKVISSVKMLSSGQDSSAYIQLTPKVYPSTVFTVVNS